MKNSISLYILGICFIVHPALSTEIGPGPVHGHWYSSGNPYNVNGEIYVPSDSTLNIHEGVEVIFLGHYKLIIYGYLEAIGTESDSILFSAADTSIGWHSIRFVDAPDSSHLSYCIIQYGCAFGDLSSFDMCGGGIYCRNSHPVINNCGIRNNSCWGLFSNGGGIACDSSSPTIRYCIINGNSTNDGGGGGISCWYFSNPSIINCTISDNSALGGGGINLDLSSLTSTNCTIKNNSANIGGGIYCIESSVTLKNNILIKNSANFSIGGGVFVVYNSNATITNCTISENSAVEMGGAIYCDYADLTILNTIIESNWGSGGISIVESSNAEIRYGDLYNNEGGNFTGDPPPGLGIIDTVNVNGDSCDVFHNIFLDPLFIDPAGGDYHLQENSPCIDAGDPSSPLDPDSTIADIGAFYYDQNVGIHRWRELDKSSEFCLLPNFPNPFNQSTTLPFTLRVASQAQLTVFDLQGRKVMTLLEEWLGPDTYEIKWNASHLPSGVYIVQLEAGSFQASQIMVLMK